MRRFEFMSTRRLEVLAGSKYKGFIRQSYDLGVLISISSAFFTAAVVLKDSSSVIKALYNLFRGASAHLHARRYAEVRESESLAENLIIKPVLPGWTNPLSDLPIFLLAFVVVQVFHEAGHALAALYESVDIVSAGVAVAFPFIPGAFVALSQSQLANISLRPRARIICAGAYHNFILALLLSVAAYICSDQLFIYVGDYGRSVTEISEKNKLYGYIHPAAIITSIDTVNLGRPSDVDEIDVDIWDEYLLSRTKEPKNHYAWLVDLAVFNSSETSCCRSASLEEAVSGAGCFVPHQATLLANREACLDPSEVMLGEPVNCLETDEEKSVCVRPHPLSHMLRIGYLGKENERESVVVQSSKRFLWETLKVSDYASRYPALMPEYLIYLLSTLANYIITLSVTFGMVNMLPLPFLDGSELVNAVLHSFNLPFSKPWRSDAIELEVGRSALRTHQRASQRRHYMWLLNAVTLSLVGFALGGSLLLNLIDSTV
ncbi:hypothetical protein E3P77_02339 [Wallemia ichthyophaga]|nr:hypothetical protein E3P77_02339 [Wallemia ichthyophaga]